VTRAETWWWNVRVWLTGLLKACSARANTYALLLVSYGGSWNPILLLYRIPWADDAARDSNISVAAAAVLPQSLDHAKADHVAGPAALHTIPPPSSICFSSFWLDFSSSSPAHLRYDGRYFYRQTQTDRQTLVASALSCQYCVHELIIILAVNTN